MLRRPRFDGEEEGDRPERNPPFPLQHHPDPVSSFRNPAFDNLLATYERIRSLFPIRHRPPSAPGALRQSKFENPKSKIQSFMKTPDSTLRLPLAFLATLTLSFFPGCQTSPSEDRKNDGQLTKDTRDIYRSLGQKVPDAYKTDSERASSRPGGTTEKEWRDISKD